MHSNFLKEHPPHHHLRSLERLQFRRRDTITFFRDRCYKIFYSYLFCCQCDKMARLFLNIWPNTTVQTCPITQNIRQSRTKILHNTWGGFFKLPKTFKILPYWQIFAQLVALIASNSWYLPNLWWNFLKMGLSRPLFLFIFVFNHITQFNKLMKSWMVCLGLEPGAVIRKAYTNPLSYVCTLFVVNLHLVMFSTPK